MSLKIEIRSYSEKYEVKWLECIKDAFYESNYFDSILKNKPRYETQAIELIAIYENHVVGLLDIEIIPAEEQLCGNGNNDLAQISLLAVSPNYRRKGIGRKLLRHTIDHIKIHFQIRKIEFFFREDIAIINLLNSLGFEQCETFYELTFTRDFFDKYNVILPFGVNPSIISGFVYEDDYRDLVNNYPPEKTSRIFVYQIDL